MPITTTIPALDSISAAMLATVIGGKKCCKGQCSMQGSMQGMQQSAVQQAPEQAPEQPPPPVAQAPSAPSISTNVQVSGYGAAPANVTG